MTQALSYPLDEFAYEYNAGPVETAEEIDQGVKAGNCRFGIQLYFYRVHKIFFKKYDIYLPGGYKVMGEFIFKEEPIDFNILKVGDVVYAQNLRDRNGREIDKSLERYRNRDEWLYYLHSVIYVGKIKGEHYVWHATHIDHGPTLWKLDKFKYYYHPVSAKRIL